MAGAAFIDAIGLISGALGIVSFIQDNLPGEDIAEGASVNVKAGISRIGDDVNNLGGEVSAVYGFNVFNEFIGQAAGQKVEEGDAVTFILDQMSPGEQSDYIGIANGNDATCVSWITVRMRDGTTDETTGGAWTGDIGSECGQRWHMGNQKAGKLKDSDVDYVPRCTWLDADFTDGTVSAALKFRVAAYGDSVADTVGKSSQCASTHFGKDEGPIAGQPAKRDLPPLPQWIMDRIIVSNITGQHAEDLCSSETSWGPDFVGVDGKFCDMSTKTLTPLCEVEDIDGCIEFSEAEKQITKRSSVARRSANIVHKTYKTVTHNHG